MKIHFKVFKNKIYLFYFKSGLKIYFKIFNKMTNFLANLFRNQEIYQNYFQITCSLIPLDFSFTGNSFHEHIFHVLTHINKFMLLSCSRKRTIFGSPRIERVREQEGRIIAHTPPPLIYLSIRFMPFHAQF